MIEIERKPWRRGDTPQHLGGQNGWHQAVQGTTNQFWQMQSTGLWAPHTLVAADIPATITGVDYHVGTASGDHSAEIVVGTSPGGELGGTWASPTVDATHAGSTHAPTAADYLVGTAQSGLSAEIVVGTSPGGELGGTWASPTVDATHSGSAHHTRLHNINSTSDHASVVYAAWTPTIVQGGTVTSLTINDCYFQQVGTRVDFYGVVSINNAGTAAGANPIRISLPVNALRTNARNYHVGVGAVYDTSADIQYEGLAQLASTTTLDLSPTSANGTAGNYRLGALGFVAALATGDVVNFSGWYEAA